MTPKNSGLAETLLFIMFEGATDVSICGNELVYASDIWPH